MQPTKGTGIGHYARASDWGEGRQEGRYVRSWGGLTWEIWRALMVVMLCEEVEGEGELIGMSGLGDSGGGGRCAQPNQKPPSSHQISRISRPGAACGFYLERRHS